MWGADQNISLAGKGVFQLKYCKVLVINRKYIHMVALTVTFEWKDPLCFALCSSFMQAARLLFQQKKDGHMVALLYFFMVAFKRPVTVEVLPSCCCMFVVEKFNHI